MKQSKNDIRKQLEAGVAVFLGQGKEITRFDAVKPKAKRNKEPKEKVVEIEVDYLPKALQTKYFGE